MAQLTPFIFSQWFTNTGVMAAGGKIQFYAAETTTPQDTYADAYGATTNANPVVLNSSGRHAIFLQDLAYDAILYDSLDNVIDSVYKINSSGSGGLSSVLNLGTLRSLAAGAFNFVEVAGYEYAGDGGGGLFYWSANATGADNNGTKILPSSGPSTGRWLRNYSGAVNVRWFGAVGDGSTSDQSAIAAANTYTQALTKGGTLFFPASTGNYVFTSNPSFGSKVKVLMDKGAGFTSTAIAMTFSGEFECAPHSQIFSSTMGAVVFSKETTLNPVMWGAVADNVTDDSTAIQTALTCAGASSGLTVHLEPKTYYIAAAITIPSYVTLQGVPGKSTLRMIDAGTRAAPFYGLTIGSGITNATINGVIMSALTVAGAPMGIHIVGTNSQILNCAALNVDFGIVIDNTAQFITVDGWKHTSPLLLGSSSIICNGAKDCNFNDLEFIGVDITHGMAYGLQFQNGNTAYGAQRIRVTNLHASKLIVSGLLAKPDNIYLGVTNNPYQTIYFKTSTGVIAGDVGKSVFQGASFIGTLVAYDDTVLPALWVTKDVAQIGVAVAANTATTISTGTGAGTTLVDNQVANTPACTDHEWVGITCNGMLGNAHISHGITLDTCYSTHLSNFSCEGNADSGVYLGDGQNFGSTVSNGTCAYNVQGITCAASAITSISNVDINNNSQAGISFVTVTNGLNKNVQYTKVSGCSIYRNSKGHSSHEDSGIGGKPTYCTFENNDIFENYQHGIGINTATYNTFLNNRIIDSGWIGTGANTESAIFIEGVSANNTFYDNLIGKRSANVTMDYGFNIQANANDTIMQNNSIIGFGTAAIIDGGLRNQDFDNLKSTDTSTLKNGSGATVRTSGASVVNLAVSGSGRTSLELSGGDTSVNKNAVLRITNLSSTVGSEPLISFEELRNIQADYSADAIRLINEVILTFDSGGYVSAIDSDINKILIGITGTTFNGAAILRSFDNSTRVWNCEMLTGTFLGASTVTISSVAVTLAGTYVTPILSDLGKTVTQQTTTAKGVLVGYDPNTQVWQLAKLNATAFTNTVNTMTIGSGTGSATQTTSNSVTTGTGTGVVATLGVTQGNLNSANGGILGIKSNGVYAIRLQERGLTLGVGGSYIVNHYSAQASLNFGNILANTTAELTIPLLGSLVGDDVVVTPNGAPESGLVWSAYISASDVATVRLGNVTAGAIDPAARSYRVSSWGH